MVPPVDDIACAGKKVRGDLPKDDLIKADIVELHRVDVPDPGIAAQAEAGLRIFHEMDIAYEIILVAFSPDIRFEGHGELLVLCIGRAGSDRRDLCVCNIRIRPKDRVTGEGDGCARGKGIADGGQPGKSDLAYFLYRVGSLFTEKEMQLIRDIFLGRFLPDLRPKGSRQ